MAAKKGNSYWRQRLEHGRKHKIKTADQLLQGALDYLEYLDVNPLYDTQVIAYQGDGYDHKVKKMRAPTLQGLWVHIGITKSTWYSYKERDGFLEVCEWVESAFFEKKFQGAAAGLLNHAIIARDLGLTDKSDITSGGEPLKGVVVSYD